MKTATLRLADIEVDFAIQPRENGLSQDHVEEIAEAYRAGVQIPRPRVWRIDDRKKLSQGFHRIEAAKRAGLTELECDVMAGTEQECAIDAAGSNRGHGLKRTNADKRQAAKIALAACPDWSDHKIAESIGVSSEFIRQIRPQLPTVGNCEPSSKRTGKDGKSYQAKPKPAKQPQPKPTSAPPPLEEVDEMIVVEPTAEDRERVARVEEAIAEELADPGKVFVKDVETLCREMDQLVTRMKGLKSFPFAYSMHVDSAASQVEAARKTLWQGRPAFECPYCQGKKCSTCNNTGRVKKGVYDRGLEAVGGGR